MKRSLLISSMILSLILTSCAYTVGMRGRTLPEGHRFVSVPLFSNKSFEPGIEVSYTNSMISELERSGLATVVDRERAEVILKGSINKLEYSYDELSKPGTGGLPEGSVLAKVVYVTTHVNYELVRKSDQKVIWATMISLQKKYNAPQVFYPVLNSANPLYDLSSRRETISQLALETSIQAFDRMTENF